MHEYYQKSSGKLKKTMRGFLSLVRLELERITKQPYDARTVDENIAGAEIR